MADKYDKLLSRALVKLKKDEFRYVPEENEIEQTFSKKHLNAIGKILNKLDRSYWKYVNTVAKKIAVIIITFIITFSSLMTVDAFRETVIDFIFTIYKNFTQVESRIKEDNHIKVFYSIASIPEKYSSVDYVLNEAIGYQTWRNEYTKITLAQNLAHTTNQFDSEHGEFREAIINNTPCFICQDNNYFFCYWEFDGYRFELIYPVDLGEDFMSEVVGNLVEIDPENMQN